MVVQKQPSRRANCVWPRREQERPIWLLDKSTLQSLSVDETLWSDGDPDHYSARGFSLLRWGQTKARVSGRAAWAPLPQPEGAGPSRRRRSEEHTSELQSRPHLVCR